MTVKANIRRVGDKGWTQRNVQVSTLGELKTWVVKELQPSWNDMTNDSFTLESSHIRVFCVDGSELEPLSDEAETPLGTDTVYLAVEYFTRVPTDMYRTASINQLQPCIYSHPEQLQDKDGRWTCVSPLYCAAMKGIDLDFPWHGAVSNSGNLSAHGISLYCKDESTDSSAPAANPLRPMEENEEVGSTRLTLEQYGELVTEECDSEHHPVYGILQYLIKSLITVTSCKK